MDERDDLIASVNQPLDVGLNLTPAADPVAKVRTDRLVAHLDAGAW